MKHCSINQAWSDWKSGIRSKLRSDDHKIFQPSVTWSVVPSERAMLIGCDLKRARIHCGVPRCFADGYWLGKEGDLEWRGNGLSSEIEIGRKLNARISVAFLNQDYKSRRDACYIDGGRELHSTSYPCCYSTTGTKQKWSLPSPWSWLMASPFCRCSWAVLPSCLVIFRETRSRETT